MCDILHELKLIKIELRKLNRVRFNASIVQQHKGDNKSMAAITAGQSGVFLLQVTASDNSTVSLAGISFTASDPNVTIANDPSDSTGATVDVTVPASDTLTTFNLSVVANASSTTAPTAVPVSATLAVTISPSSVPVTFTAQIVEK